MKRIVGFLISLSAYAQPASNVYMNQSYVAGNPVTLEIGIDGTVSNLRLVMGTGYNMTLWGTCYVTIDGTSVGVWDTQASSEGPENPRWGTMGTAAALTSPQCSVDLLRSSRNWNTIFLRIQSNAVGDVSPVQARFVNNFSQEVWTQIGSWNVGSLPGPTPPPQMSTPGPGSTLGGTSSTFSWFGNPTTPYALTVGTQLGSADLYSSGTILATSVTVTGLPNAGQLLYVRLSVWSGANWVSNDFSYRAYTVFQPSMLSSPANGGTLTGTTSTLVLTPGVNVANRWVSVGTTPGGGDLSQYTTKATSVVVPAVPADGRAVYVTVSSQVDNGWAQQSYTLRAPGSTQPPVTTPAQLTSPAAGTILSGSVTFTWDAGVGVTQYALTVGTRSGWVDLAQVYRMPNEARSATVNIPATGNLVFVSLQSLVNPGGWQGHTYYFSTPNQNAWVPYTTAPAQLLPVGGAVSGPTTTLQWTPGTNASQYWLAVGTTAGGNDLYNERNLGTNTLSATVTSIPPNVSNVYATLYSKIGNAWQPTQATISVIQPTSSQIPESVRTCLATPGTPTNPRECSLPYGLYYMSYEDGLRNSGLIHVNRPLIIGASYVTLRGLPSPTGQKPRFIRYETAWHDPGGAQNPCGSMIRFFPGISDVLFDNFDIEGGALAKAGFCLSSDPTEVYPQPVSIDVELGTAAAVSGMNFLRNITLNSINFTNAVGRALSIWGPDIENIRVTNSVFREANLTGILIGRNWAVGEEPPVSCTATQASGYNVPRNILIENTRFYRSWTGATSQNNARDTVYRNNEFIDNYYQPYDQGGGTVNDEVCTYNTQFLGRNVFDGRGVDKDTSALELHGLNTRVQGEGGNRTEIRNYFGMGIIARSVAGLVIRDAVIQDNARLNQALGYESLRWGGIEFYNVCQPETDGIPCRRLIRGVDVQNVTINNSVFGPNGAQKFAIRFSRRWGTQPANPIDDQAFDVVIVNTQLSPNALGTICYPQTSPPYFGGASTVPQGPSCETQ